MFGSPAYLENGNVKIKNRQHIGHYFVVVSSVFFFLTEYISPLYAIFTEKLIYEVRRFMEITEEN